MCDLHAALFEFEQGTLDVEASIDLFQTRIETGLAWDLVDKYSNTAASLIEEGYCVINENDA